MHDRRVVLSMQVSLDGYVAGPKGDGDLEEIMRTMDEEVFAQATNWVAESDTMLMGRANYLEQAAHWPSVTDGLGPALNAMTKIVFSKTLSEVTWEGTRIATGTPAEEIARLRAQPGKAIAVSGGAWFVRSLIADGLLDEVRLTVHPVVLGGGTPLFTDLQRFELLATYPLPGGAVQLRYAPVYG